MEGIFSRAGVRRRAGERFTSAPVGAHMIAVPWALCAVLLWLVLCALVDRRNARRENVPFVSFKELVVVLGVAAAGTLLAPAPERLAVGIALAGLGVAACGDLRHRYLWEELSVPTLFLVLAAGALAGFAPSVIAGTAILGGIALAVYFGGQLAGKDPGFGDVIPTAIVGAALGPIPALGAFAIACALFALVALALGKRFGVALPFGPAIVGALLLGAAGSSLVVGAWR